MFKRNRKREAVPADVAGPRANLYGLLISILNQLPDRGFLKKIEEGLFEEIFHGFTGVEYLKSYRSRIGQCAQEEVVAELSVDRTRILRGTGPWELKPPYEGCYKRNCDLGTAIMGVKCSYRSGGLMLDETVPESPDYLCVELDFMKHLCKREKDERTSAGNAAETLIMQTAFLREHLGCWIDDFCEQVEKHALTDFYRGVFLILKDFIAKETIYLQDMNP